MGGARFALLPGFLPTHHPTHAPPPGSRAQARRRVIGTPTKCLARIESLRIPPPLPSATVRSFIVNSRGEGLRAPIRPSPNTPHHAHPAPGLESPKLGEFLFCVSGYYLAVSSCERVMGHLPYFSWRRCKSVTSVSKSCSPSTPSQTLIPPPFTCTAWKRASVALRPANEPPVQPAAKHLHMGLSSRFM